MLCAMLKSIQKYVICLAMLCVLRCYVSCDVMCLAMLYVYVKIQTTKNKKQKKTKKESGENNMYCSLVFPFLPCIFCHSFLHFVTHFYKNGKVNKTLETKI